jgi:hypothetical protein
MLLLARAAPAGELVRPHCHLTFSDGTDPYGLLDSERLVLRLDDAPDGTVSAIWGANVGSYLSGFTRTEKGLSSLRLLALRVEPQEPDSFDPSIWFRTVDLVLIDQDDDGEVDAVEGTGTGEFHQILGDVEHDQPFTVELRGERDATPPVLAIDGDTAAFNVLDQVVIMTNEPLDPATTAVLSYGDTRVVLGQGPGASPYARSFGASTLLPFGTDLRIELDPAPRDLAGLASENVPTTVRTMAAPGLLSEDGSRTPATSPVSPSCCPPSSTRKPATRRGPRQARSSAWSMPCRPAPRAR